MKFFVYVKKNFTLSYLKINTLFDLEHDVLYNIILIISINSSRIFIR